MTTTSPPAHDTAATSGEPPGTHPAPRWTILLVDDEPDILSSIKLVVERSKKGVKVESLLAELAGSNEPPRP